MTAEASPRRELFTPALRGGAALCLLATYSLAGAWPAIAAALVGRVGRWPGVGRLWAQLERVLAAWTVLALLPWRVQYPWYFLWPCATAFAGADRLHRWLWAPCLILGVQLTLLYKIPYQP